MALKNRLDQECFSQYYSILPNYHLAVRLALNHFRENGFQTVAYVGSVNTFGNRKELTMDPLEQHGCPPKAMFVASDSIAPGIMMALQESNLSVPENTGIVTFNNSRTSLCIHQSNIQAVQIFLILPVSALRYCSNFRQLCRPWKNALMKDQGRSLLLHKLQRGRRLQAHVRSIPLPDLREP
ncbi:MAG: substrate-binding domain-containing protein [Lachnospiraceae bacterium]|nr:substrate-binding domain-containing protein [Lachnospiraceae bacterium]